MGRGRSTATAAASAAATTGVPAATRSGVKSVQPVEKNGKDQVAPPPDESDDSSHDSGVRRTRRSLPVSKEQNANAIIPKQTDKASNIRSRLRKSTQLNHTASLNLVENRVQKNVNFSSSNNSGIGTDELLVVSDGILTRFNVNHEVATSNIKSTIERTSDAVGNENMNLAEIPDETDNASLDTDTLTPDSSLIPDSNETTCSADDEAESSVFSEDSQTRSSSIIAVSQEDSNSMQTYSVDKQREQNSVANENSLTNKCLVTTQDASKIDRSSRRSVTPRLLEVEATNSNPAPFQTETPKKPENTPPHETPDPEERLLSSPDFFNLPKPKIVRTYQNKRKQKMEALKAQAATQEAAAADVDKLQVNSGTDKTNTEKEPDKSKNEKVLPVDQQEVTECRRSQRQRVIKYDVRDLFNMKGSRNQSDSKNSRSSLPSQKLSRDSPRSDVSSSPQTFKGFSDTDDPSSPMSCTRRPLSRQSNATPTPPPFDLKANETFSKVDTSEKYSKLSKTPDVDEFKGSTQANDTDHNSSSSGKSPETTADMITQQRMKTTKVPLKKEPQKPSRILPRRKTVLLNRSSEEIADLLDECISQEQFPSSSAKSPEQAKSKSKTFDEHDSGFVPIPKGVHSEKVGLSTNTKTDEVKSNLSFPQDRREDEIAMSSAFKSSSVQCDLEKNDTVKSSENVPTISENSSEGVPLKNDVTTVSMKDQKSEVLEVNSTAMASNQSQLSIDCLIENVKAEGSKENLVTPKLCENTPSAIKDDQNLVDSQTKKGKSSPVRIEEKSKQQNKRATKSKSRKLDLTIDSEPKTPENSASRRTPKLEQEVVRTPDLEQKSVSIKETTEAENLGNLSNEKSRKSTKAQTLSKNGNSVNIPEKSETLERKEKVTKDKENEVQLSISSDKRAPVKGVESSETNVSTECQNSEIHEKLTSVKLNDEKAAVSPKRTESLSLIDSNTSDGGGNLVDRKKCDLKKKQTSKRPKTKAEMKLIVQRVDSPIDSESSISDKVPTVVKTENTKRRSKEGSKPLGRSKQSESKESELEQKTTNLKRTSLIATSESERSDKSREFSEKNPKKRKLSSIVPDASEVVQVEKAVSERPEVEKLGLSAISKDLKVGVTEKSKVKKLELEKRKEKLCMLEDIDIFAGKEVDSTASDKIRKSKESRRSTLKKENKASAKRCSNSLGNVTVTSTLDAKGLNEGSKQDQSNILDNKKSIKGGSKVNEVLDERSTQEESNIFDKRLIKGGGKDNDVNSCEPTGAAKADKLEIEIKNRVLKADSSDKPLSPMTCQNSKKDASHAASLKSVDVSKSETKASESETMTAETANISLMEPNAVMTTKGNGGSAESCKNIENSNEDVFQIEQMGDKKSLPEYEKSHLDSSDENNITHDSNSKAADLSGAATPTSSSNEPQHEVCDDGRSVVTLPENEKNLLDRPEMMKTTPAISQTTVKNSAENSSSVTQEAMTKSQNSAEPRKTSTRGRKKFNDSDRQIEASLDDSYVEAKSKSQSSIKGNVTSTKIQSRHSIDVDLQKIDEKLAKIQASMMKGYKRNGQPRKGRTKRSLSKSLSTSDGVSDAYSSDSNDSKQSIRNNTENAAKSEKGSVSHQKEDPLSQPLNNSLPPASNLSSVLNGLSKVVMNDLLEWTCNNKQTVLQIKDTIDQNQRETSTLKSDVERSENIQDSAESEAIKADLPKKMNNNDSLCEVEQGKQSTQSLDETKESQNKDVKKDTITTPSKDPAVIQTSKEMLAELMNSTLDIDLDNFADSSESAEKSELITKSKLSQEIKRLIKSSDGEFSVKSSDSEQTDQNSQDSSANIRRSHRIKTQIKSTVGRGLVRDKSDRNQNSASALDLEAQNARFLKDMEERLSQFQMIKENEYKCERIISKEAKRMTCDCFLTKEEEERGELGCGEDCLNRLLMIECSSKCTVGERCTNRRFQKYQHARCKVFRTEKKGFGIMADGEIPAGEFIMEYVGEVLNGKQFEKRAAIYSQDKNKHYYFMALRGDSIIDATMKGSISRFINHSCDPNAETQKWTVNGELRIGFFSKRKIYAGEEITFDYQFQRYGKEAQKCFCESVNCRGWIGEEPDSEDEEEEVSSSESEDEVEAKSPEDAEAEKDKRLELKVAEKEKVTPTVAIQEEGDNAEILKEITAIEKPPGEILEGKAEKVIPIETPTDKDKSARKALKAAEKFAKIAAKMKARKERERIKQQNRMVMEDPDLEAEIVSLESSGLINQAHTLKLSRCMVRAKSVLSKLRLLSVLQKGEMACRRLFLDYHGLRLLHGWMSENETADIEQDLEFRQKTLKTLELLPIPNKTMLKESKVFDVVQSWSTEMEQQISSSETPLDSSDRQSPPLKKQKIDDGNYQEIRMEIKDIADKLTTTWEVLPEVFRIPKRERIEQMKEHEREADRSYKALNLGDEDQYNKQLRSQERFGAKKSYKWARDKYEKRKELTKDTEKLTSAEANLTKLQRRQLFAAKVAKDEAEKRLAEERREFEFKCKFYGLDPRYMTPNIMPFCVNPSTGQWYSKEKNKIPTPPSHAHIKVPPKPQSTDPKDYKMPEVDLPPMWKFAMDPRGRLYYYHIKIRIPQWEPPIKILPLTRDPSTESTALEEGSTNVIPSTSTSKVDDPQPGTSKQSLPTSDTSSGSDDTDSDISCSEIIGLKKGVPLKLGKDMIEQLKRSRKRKRFNRLVQERTISPRREEDRLYNQIETRRYRENKEKIRRRKEEIKRRKAQLKREAENDQSTSNKDANSQPSQPSSPKSSGGKVSVPIQDYLLSSDEDELEKSDYDNSLIEKIVHGDNIVDELDAIAKEKPLKRSLPFVKDHDLKKRMKMDEKKRAEGSKSDKSIKSRKTEAGSTKNTSRRAREKFRSDIAGIIVHHLTPYRRDSCHIGRITNNDDFKHLARKLTHFVLIKELKHCDTTGQTLVVTESVKNKSREFIKKYMAKYGEVYVRPANDPEFRDIPH